MDISIIYMARNHPSSPNGNIVNMRWEEKIYTHLRPLYAAEVNANI